MHLFVPSFASAIGASLWTTTVMATAPPPATSRQHRQHVSGIGSAGGVSPGRACRQTVPQDMAASLIHKFDPVMFSRDRGLPANIEIRLRQLRMTTTAGHATKADPPVKRTSKFRMSRWPKRQGFSTQAQFSPSVGGFTTTPRDYTAP